jgi:hypothetical protein
MSGANNLGHLIRGNSKIFGLLMKSLGSFSQVDSINPGSSFLGPADGHPLESPSPPSRLESAISTMLDPNGPSPTEAPPESSADTQNDEFIDIVSSDGASDLPPAHLRDVVDPLSNGSDHNRSAAACNASSDDPCLMSHAADDGGGHSPDWEDPDCDGCSQAGPARDDDDDPGVEFDIPFLNFEISPQSSPGTDVYVRSLEDQKRAWIGSWQDDPARAPIRSLPKRVLIVARVEPSPDGEEIWTECCRHSNGSDHVGNSTKCDVDVMPDPM